MAYDLLIQTNHVFIGMEDVSTTYRNKLPVFEDMSEDEIINTVNEFYDNFVNSDQYKNHESGYYPTQWNEPCRAIIAPVGTFESNNCTNYNQLYKAKQNGAIDLSFVKLKKDELNEKMDDFFEKEKDDLEI